MECSLAPKLFKAVLTGLCKKAIFGDASVTYDLIVESLFSSSSKEPQGGAWVARCAKGHPAVAVAVDRGVLACVTCEKRRQVGACQRDRGFACAGGA